MTEQNDNECGFFAEMSRLEALSDDLQVQVKRAFDEARYVRTTDDGRNAVVWYGGQQANVYGVLQMGDTCSIEEQSIFSFPSESNVTFEEAKEHVDDKIESLNRM